MGIKELICLYIGCHGDFLSFSTDIFIHIIILCATFVNGLDLFYLNILIFFINITLATYVLKLPGIFDWDNVFLLLVGGSKTLEVFLIKLIFNILFWMGLSAILFMYKVKERYQNE